MIKQQVVSACRHLLGPIVRMLLRSGVPWEEFSELSKEVYVDIARRDYGIQGRPTNLARVAMITGLSRREVGRVRKLLDEGSPPPASAKDRLSHILTGWHLDPEFQDQAGQPLVLGSTGDDATIEGLFRKYGGDMPHGALLKELLQLGLVEEANAGTYRVLARDYVRGPQDPEIVRQTGIALHDHANTLAHNINQERATPPRFEGMATNLISKRHSRALEKLIEDRGTGFLEEIDEWLSRHEADDDIEAEGKRKTAHTRMGVGVFLIYDD